MNFREWTEEDQPKIKDLYRLIAHEYFPDMMIQEEFFNAYVKDVLNIKRYFYKTGGKYWVCEKDDEIIAMGGVRLLKNNVAELKNFRVHEDHRGQGLGKKILEACENFCREVKVSKIILDTTDRFTTAIQMYRSQGYVIDEEKEMELLGVKYIQLNFHKNLDEK